jgi:hypothetical protein
LTEVPSSISPPWFMEALLRGPSLVTSMEYLVCLVVEYFSLTMLMSPGNYATLGLNIADFARLVSYVQPINVCLD